MTPPIRSTLPTPSFLILGSVGLNVVILVFVLTLISSGILPRYGVSVVPAESRYHIGTYDPAYMRVLTITPGDSPRCFLESKLIKDGVRGLSREFDELIEKTPQEHRHHLTIVLYADKSISLGMVQSVIDLVLSKGMHCASAAEPGH